MYEDRLIVIRLVVELDEVIYRLACCWLENHSSNYTIMDGPKPRWDRLLKRVFSPLPPGKPTQPDKFFAPAPGGNMVLWLLFGQLIGPHWHFDTELDTLEEYWELWAHGLQLSDEYRDRAGRHFERLPYLWTLEAPPPHFFSTV